MLSIAHHLFHQTPCTTRFESNNYCLHLTFYRLPLSAFFFCDKLIKIIRGVFDDSQVFINSINWSLCGVFSLLWNTVSKTELSGTSVPSSLQQMLSRPHGVCGRLHITTRSAGSSAAHSLVYCKAVAYRGGASTFPKSLSRSLSWTPHFLSSILYSKLVQFLGAT